MSSSYFTQIGSDIDGETTDDRSGWSVSLSSDGKVVAIGATHNDANGNSSGHVRVYKNVNGTWMKEGSDIDGEVAEDELGYSVSLSSDGKVVAIGAHQNDTGRGYVRIYKNIDNNWIQAGGDIDGEALGDNSGRSVSLSSDGDVVAIGEILAEASGSSNGQVRIYKNINDNWSQIGNDIVGEDAMSFSGRSVSLSSDGSIVAIGADWNDGNGTHSGHVRIYKNVDNTWIQIGDDIDGEASGDRSGWSVSLSSDGSIVAIGASHNDGNGTDSGHVRIYKNVDNTWIQIGDDIDGEASEDTFGISVSLSADGSIIAIGSHQNDENGSDSGHIRIYKNFDDNWIKVGSDIGGEASEDGFGISVSLAADGSVVAVGAPRNDGNGIDSGHVRIYQIDLDTTAPSAPSSLLTSSLASDNTPTITGTAEAGTTVTLYSGSISDNKTIIYNVSVEAKTEEHNSYSSGSSFGYKINNNFAPNLSLTPGSTYIFDQSDSSNLNHPLLFYLDSNKTNSYQENVISRGTPGTSGAYTQIQITSDSPQTLYYQCSNHGLMGDSLITNLGSTTADSNGTFSITSSALSDGNYSITATATDSTGNISPPSSVLSVVVNQNLITGDFEWAKLFGSSAGEEAYGISIDNAGNIFLTGSTEGNLNGQVNNGEMDTFIMKLDSNGNEIWTKLFGSIFNEIAYGISIDNESNIFITGTTEGNLNGQLNNGDMDTFVMKLDSNGNEIWTKLFGTELSDIAWKSTIDDNIYLWGETHGNLNGEVNNFLGNEDAFLIKLDSNGNEVWTSLIGTELHEEAWDIAITNDDSVYLVGETQDSKVPNNDNTDDILVSKIDPQGNILWSKSFGEFQKEDRATSVQIDAGGNLYVSGFTESDLNGQLVNGSSGSFLMKLDNDGNEIWTKLYGISNRENAFDMGMRSDGYIYLTGMSDPNDKGFLKKIDLDGNEIWTKFFGNSNWDWYRNLYIENNGSSIYISGETRGDLENNISNGETDAILYKFSDPFSLSESRALNYIASNHDLISVFGIDTSLAKSHYANYGKSEGRSITAFSASNYLAKYSDLKTAYGDDQTSALKHYIEYGFSEGRTDILSESGSGSESGITSDLTDLEALNYIASHGDLINAFGIDTEAAKSHYTNYGKAEGRSLTSFNASSYLEKYSDLKIAYVDDQTAALKHYLQYGFSEGRTDTLAESSSGSGSSSGSSSNLTDFEALNYIASHGDLINAFGTDTTSAKSHYTNYGKSEGRILDKFDEWGYLASNNELINSLGSDTTEAVKHYISFGQSQGKLTNSFDAQSYLNNYSDLRNAFGNDKELATKHYVEYGFNEGRVF